MSIQTLISSSEFEEIALASAQRMELVDGEVKTMSPVSLKHSQIVLEIGLYLRMWIKAGAGGIVGTELGFNLAPNTTRAADVFYLSPERSAGLEDYDGFWEGAPDLAVEVISPTERASDIEEKIVDYMQAGTRLMWIVYPRLRTVHVIRPGQPRHILGADATLEAPDVLPGFSLAIASLFV